MNRIEPLHRETVRRWLGDHLGPPTSEVNESHFWLVRGTDGYGRLTVRWDGWDGGLQAWDTRNYRSIHFDSLQALEAIVERARTTREPQGDRPDKSQSEQRVRGRSIRGVLAKPAAVARRIRGT